MGGGQAGPALALAGVAGDALDVFGWDVEKVGGDRSVAAGEHQAGTLDALVDGVGARRRAGAEPGAPGTSSASGPWAAAAGSLFDYSDVSAANEFHGSQVGSQRRQVPIDVRPHWARIAAGDRPARRRLAPSCDSRGLYGMQEVRGSNPLSSTFSQLRGML